MEVNAMVVDQPSHLLYFCDGIKGTIEAFDYTNSLHRIIATAIKPRGLAIDLADM
jgi:hypothetical protein